MHSYLTIALLTLAPNASWENNYCQAQQHAVAVKKPLAVVFGAGAQGWTKVVRAETPRPEVDKLLAEHYVCVYVDTTTPEGKKLAQNFQIATGVGLVISDRAGTTQAFWHQGDMTNDNIVHYLTKYSDPNVVVAQTETIPARTSFYPSTNYAAPAGRTVNC